MLNLLKGEHECYVCKSLIKWEEEHIGTVGGGLYTVREGDIVVPQIIATGNVDGKVQYEITATCRRCKVPNKFIITK